ncbi:MULTISPECIES: TcpD family membrane protein [unclassified Listeria]|uniref:TcpD family membrane protein n=1 Tax=unclassified Listeria TaxID=2642072 RepID=UPI000B5874D1|nr:MULTISPECIES: TcpD family membrane protein [unclassified Listeria]
MLWMSHLAFGALPSLGGLTSYVSTETANAATIVLVVMAVVFLFKQQIGKFIGFIAFAAAVMWIIGDPNALISAIKAIWEKVV